MKLPNVKGIIDRRILINFQVDEGIISDYLPNPFKPQLIKGKAIAGICLIRLKEIRPIWLPKQIGISSENGAHRIAVEWNHDGEEGRGVYIPRRDTSSNLNALAGGRLFPGIHHLSQFMVNESEDSYEVAFKNDDGTYLSIEAKESTEWNDDSVFSDLLEVSDFFESGSIGYSPSKDCYDGLMLETKNWSMSNLEVNSVKSSFFEDRTVFPEGSVKFDSALLMKNIHHEWVGMESIYK